MIRSGLYSCTSSASTESFVRTSDSILAPGETKPMKGEWERQIVLSGIAKGLLGDALFGRPAPFLCPIHTPATGSRGRLACFVHTVHAIYLVISGGSSRR